MSMLNSPEKYQDYYKEDHTADKYNTEAGNKIVDCVIGYLLPSDETADFRFPSAVFEVLMDRGKVVLNGLENREIETERM